MNPSNSAQPPVPVSDAARHSGTTNAYYRNQPSQPSQPSPLRRLLPAQPSLPTISTIPENHDEAFSPVMTGVSHEMPLAGAPPPRSTTDTPADDANSTQPPRQTYLDIMASQFPIQFSVGFIYWRCLLLLANLTFSDAFDPSVALFFILPHFTGKRSTRDIRLCQPFST